jgi:FixJ family two-component response regulator
VTAASPARVFLVDDDPFQLHFLGGILRAAGHAVEAFDRPEALLARLSAADRGCVVLDLQMPELDGLALQRAFVEREILLPLIFVSGQADVPAAVAAMKQGAVDFLSKPVDPEALRAASARAIARDADAAAQRADRDRARARWAALSSRERDVCRLLARGLLNKQIAAELGITESTAQVHRSRALQKLGVSTAADVIRILAQVGDAA